MKFIDYFDQIYILHLDTLTDRKLSIINHINEFNLKNITIIDALNKNSINIEKMREDGMLAYSGNSWCKDSLCDDNKICWCGGSGHNDVTNYPGRIAVGFAHYFAYKDIVKNKYEKCLILEDDFILNKNLNTLWNNLYEDIPEDWELLYFCNGRKIWINNDPSKRSKNDTFTVVNKSFVHSKTGIADAGCYAITFETAKILYKNFLPLRAAADGYLSVHVHPLKIIKNMYVYRGDLSKNGSYAFVCGNNNPFASCNDLLKINESENALYNKKELNECLKYIVNNYCFNNIDSKYLI